MLNQIELSLSSSAIAELTRAVISKNTPFRFQVKGFSMSPFIKNRDVVTISPLNDSPIGIGKIVAFVHPGSEKLLIHRIIAKKRNLYAIEGDRLFGRGGLIPRKNIIGLITKIERKGREFCFGLGPERFIIALLSRIKVLPFVFQCWRFISVALKRFLLWEKV